MKMGLLRNETWDDYLDKEVCVIFDNHQRGFIGTLLRWDDDIVVVEEHDTEEEHELPHNVVYGMWMLEGW
jgi:hypothetical protein|tara:strand:+ start:540 stop:749 length:210 start_codon:yes stop_codon:yes gene_type:complete